jgi:hypothetical protein
MQNKVISLFSDQCWHIMTLNTNVKCILLVPGMHGGAAIPQTTAHMVLHLSTCPKDLWVLWKEWERGLGGGKPAKAYTSAERGANEFSFLHHKVFWDPIKGMVRRGQTLDVAINNIYRAHEWKNSVTKILSNMMNGWRRGVKRV